MSVPSLAAIADRHAAAAEIMMKELFPDVTMLPGFDYRSGHALAGEVNRAINQCQQKKRKSVLLCFGSYLGAGGDTIGSQTDKNIMGVLGDVPHAFIDAFPIGVNKVKSFDAAGGRQMFHEVPERVSSSDSYKDTVAGGVQVLLAAVRAVQSAGLEPVIMVLSPDVGKLLRGSNVSLPECLELPVHPSGARSNPATWDALRGGLQEVQVVIYANENGCSRADARTILGAERLQNHDRVRDFCVAQGVRITSRTPASFFYVQFDVIEYAFNQLKSVGLADAIFATKLWYTMEEVDEVMANSRFWAQKLGQKKLATASCDGFWHFLSSENGPAVAKEWRGDLGPDNFATLSNDSFWHFVATEGGEIKARSWQRKLGDDFVTIGKCTSFWSLLLLDGGDAKIDWWRNRLRDDFTRVAHSCFFHMLRSAKGVEMMQQLLLQLEDTFSETVAGCIWPFITDHGVTAAMAWIDLLGHDVKKISRLSCFWSMVRANRAGMASSLVKKWLPKVRDTAVGHRNAFWMVLGKEGGDAFLTSNCSFLPSGIVTNTRVSFLALQSQFLRAYNQSSFLSGRDVEFDANVLAAYHLQLKQDSAVQFEPLEELNQAPGALGSCTLLTASDSESRNCESDGIVYEWGRILQQDILDPPLTSMTPQMRVMAVWTPKSCGLENVGNSCYMNSGLQCLLATTELTHMFVRGLYSQHLNVSNKDGCKGSGSQSGQLAEAFNLLVDQTHTHSARGSAPCVPWQHVGTAVVPLFMKRILGQFNPNFANFEQHDGQEVIGTLLDGLHEDLNGVTFKSITANPVGNGSNDEEVALIAQSRYKQRHDSFVADTFQGEFLNRVTCPGCRTQTVTFDPSMFLPLAFKKSVTGAAAESPAAGAATTLAAMLESFVEAEVLTGDNRWRYAAGPES